MIKIITALGNPKFNYDLRRFQEFEIISNDIQYTEGVIEILELNKDIDYIVLSELLDGEIELNELLNKIFEINKKIKIIIILKEKNIELEEKLIQKGIFDIFYNKSDTNEIINILKNKNIEITNMELRAEIEKLKEIIIEKENINKKNNKIFKNKSCEFLINNFECKIIGIAGNNGIGKSTFLYLLSNYLSKKFKILIINFDTQKDDINYLFNIKKEYFECEDLNMKNIKNSIKEIKNNLYFLNNVNYFLNKFTLNDFINKINLIKNNYDFILIDTNNYYEKNDTIFKFFDDIFLLSSTNKFEIEKNKKIINNLQKKYKINKEIIKIIAYKISLYEIFLCRKKLKKEDFCDYNYLGKIKKYNYINNILKSDKVINYFFINNIINNLFIKKITNNYIKYLFNKNNN